MVERKIKKKEMERKEEGKERKVIKKGKRIKDGNSGRKEGKEERKQRKSISRGKRIDCDWRSVLYIYVYCFNMLLAVNLYLDQSALRTKKVPEPLRVGGAMTLNTKQQIQDAELVDWIALCCQC